MTKVATDDLLQMVQDEAIKQGVDPDTAKAIMLSENSYFDRGGNLIKKSSVDTGTLSPMNAQGIMQVIPSTAASLVRKGFVPPTLDFKSPEGQVTLGVAAIKELNSRGITNPSEVAVGYNGSPAVLDQFRAGKTMNPETTDYLKKFSAHYTGSAVPMASAEQDDPTSFAAQSKPGSSTMERLSVSESKKTLPPGAAEELRTKYAATSELGASLMAQLKTLSGQIVGGAETTGEAAVAEGKAKAAAAMATAQQGVLTNQSQNQIASAYGVNLNTDPDSVIGRNMQIVSDSRDQRIDLQEQIAQLKSTGGSPLTDPIGWLMNSVRQLPLIAQHNALVTKENNAANNISLAQGLAKQQASFQPAAIGEAINAKGVADATAAIAEGEAKKQTYMQAARTHVAQFIIDQQRISGQDLSHLLAVDDVLATHTTTTSAMSERQKEEDDQMKPFRLAAESLGLDPKMMTKAVIKGLDPATQAKWSKFAAFGRAGVSPGDTVAMLYDTYGTVGLANMDKDAPGVGAFMKSIVTHGQAELSNLEGKAAMDPKVAQKLKAVKNNPSDQLAYGIDSWAKQKEVEADPDKQNFAKLPQDNPYKLNYGYAAGRPELKDNPLAKIVAGLPKGVDATDQLLLSSAVADINNTTNPKSPGQAAQEIVDFYSKGLAAQTKSSQMETLGFKPKDRYPMVAKVGTITSQPVDMLNRASVERFLVHQAVAAKVTSQYGAYLFAPEGGALTLGQ